MTLDVSKIQAELKQIEQEEGVRILYACESGSRAWGFPSKDSDFEETAKHISVSGEKQDQALDGLFRDALKEAWGS